MSKDESFAAAVQRAVDAAPPLTEAAARRAWGLLLAGEDPREEAWRPPRAPAAPAPPSVLYRYLDAAGVLLYVGLTIDDQARGWAHARESYWHRYAARVVRGDMYASRADAAAAEAAAIRDEGPVFNVVHAKNGHARAVRYIAGHGDWHLLALRGVGGVDRPGVREVIEGLITDNGDLFQVTIRPDQEES